MELEKQRGISVTSSVMQFPYAGRIVNLLDTPGHEDFSEDTYRTLTAVRLRPHGHRRRPRHRVADHPPDGGLPGCATPPIVTFVNKLDRREPRARRAARRDRERAGTPVRAGDLADRERPAVQGGLPPARRSGPLLQPAPRRAHRRGRGRRGHRQPGARRAARDAGRGAARGSGARARREPRARRRRLPVRPHDPGVLRVRSQQLRSPRAAGDVRRAGAAARAARGRAAHGRSGGGSVQRVRVQDPGEHGPAAPRP